MCYCDLQEENYNFLLCYYHWMLKETKDPASLLTYDNVRPREPRAQIIQRQKKFPYPKFFSLCKILLHRVLEMSKSAVVREGYWISQKLVFELLILIQHSFIYFFVWIFSQSSFHNFYLGGGVLEPQLAVLKDHFWQSFGTMCDNWNWTRDSCIQAS